MMTMLSFKIRTRLSYNNLEYKSRKNPPIHTIFIQSANDLYSDNNKYDHHNSIIVYIYHYLIVRGEHSAVGVLQRQTEVGAP